MPDAVSTAAPVEDEVGAGAGAVYASIVIATYKRQASLHRLLEQLGAQTVRPEQFEVVVVDDGSPEPFTSDGLVTPYRLVVIRQVNAGPAVARHRGAQEAGGEILIVIDDDVQIDTGFLAAHLSAHADGVRRAAIGPIDPDPDGGRLPLFEQWNAERLRRSSLSAAAGRTLYGTSLTTGNVSFRRADYFAVGGFDFTLRYSEDAELGLRLENAGVTMAYVQDARVIHCSDHTDATWFARARAYGRVDRFIARKHAGVIHANPWRYYYELPSVARLMLALEVAQPALGQLTARTALTLGQCLLAVGARRAAIRVAALVFASEYFHGVRDEEGSRAACTRSRRAYLADAAAQPELPAGVPRRRAQWLRMRADLRADRDMRARHAKKFGHPVNEMSPVVELLNKIAVQMMAAIRLMSFFRDSGHPLLAKMVSRLIRHAYGSDVHWDAQWAPGVAINHGFGLAISGAARIGPDCILFQNVTLGMSFDSQTYTSGAPVLERAVHVGPGATLLGPIVVGAGTKVMAGAVLSQSVPAGCLVETPAPRVRPRKPEADTASAPARADEQSRSREAPSSASLSNR